MFTHIKTHMTNYAWGCALIIPAMIMYLLHFSSLNWACTNFIVIFSAALVMWVFRLVPEYAPAVFVILATMLLGLAPQPILLSGFMSDSFFLALSIFGLGAVIVKSKIFYRVALIILNKLPKRLFLLQAVVFSIGALLTPIMTAQSSRVALIAPLLDDISQSAGLRARSRAANSLAVCAFNGAILLSVIFLTGKSSNFVLFGMLSEQTQWQFNWLNWFLASSVPGLMMIVVFFIIIQFQFKTKSKLRVDLALIQAELSQLGAVTKEEWAVIISVTVLVFGLITSSIHQIPVAWFSFAIFFVFLTTGILTKSDFKNRINWPFLFYLGAIIGIMRCVQVIGIDTWIVTYLSFLSDIADDSVNSFIIMVYLISWLGGLLFGTAAAPALLFTILLPIAQHALISSWLVAFIILMATEAWLFPYQSSYYLCFEEIIHEKRHYSMAPLLKLNAYFSVIRLLVIIACIPFWHSLGIL
jgi:divalent anion:Na+ symporter, DASS family